MLAALLLTPLALTAQESKTPLRFSPSTDRTLEVTYVHETEWDYPKNDMQGELHTELTLHWRFERKKNAENEWAARGQIVEAIYRGEGVKAGREFHHDIEWTKAKGYLKGEDSEAAEKWIDEEVKKEIRFDVDRRGAADPGIC